MKYVVCILIGYLLGSISLAALFSKLTNVNLRKSGTGNLGATNVFLILGKSYGVFVMLFDIAKAFAAAKIAQHIVPDLEYAGMLAGLGAVIGHIFPFYMKFKGGKGLAAFGGMILASDPMIFLILLVIGLILMLIFNYSVAMPMSAAVLFPILLWSRSKSIMCLLLSIAAGALIAVKHAGNITKARQGTDVKIREYLKTNFSLKDDPEENETDNL